MVNKFYCKFCDFRTVRDYKFKEHLKNHSNIKNFNEILKKDKELKIYYGLIKPIDITLFVTSCGRPTLLKITLESFVKHNNYPIKEAVIIEDSGKKGIIDFAKDILPYPCKIIYNEKNLGLFKSTLKGLESINTDWIFHCEDDWQFNSSNFIQNSLEIFNRNNTITLVTLIKHNHLLGKNFEKKAYDYYRYMKEYGAAGNYTTNPGLRKKEIYEPMKNLNNEGEVSLYYRKKGMKVAATLKTKGYLTHIGGKKSVYKVGSAYKKFSDTNK